MKCLQVQEAIWCGELTTHEMQTHIASCPECQQEQHRVHEMSFSLKNIQVPMQSRTLIPSPHEIDSALRTRRRQHITKWITGCITAAACVTLALLSVSHLLPSKSTAHPITAQPKPTPILSSIKGTYTPNSNQGQDNNLTTASTTPTPGQHAGQGQTTTAPAQSGGQTTIAPAQPGGPSTNDWRQINTTTYSLKIPPYMETITNQQGWTTFLNQGKVMGNLEIEDVRDHAPGDAYNAVFLPNHTDVISKRQMDFGIANLYIVQFNLKYTPPAADPNAPPTTGTRTYFIDDNNHHVYDLSFSDGALDAETLQGIVQSFTIKN